MPMVRSLSTGAKLVLLTNHEEGFLGGEGGEDGVAATH